MQAGTPGEDIGFLVDEGKYYEVIRVLTEYMSSWCIDKDMSVFVFTIDDIDLKNHLVCTKSFNIKSKKVQISSIPSIIYNTSICYNKRDIRKLRYLFDDPSITFVNKVNRYDQDMIYDILTSHSDPLDFLLFHCPFDLDTLNDVVEEWERVFLLPIKSPDLKNMIRINKSSYMDVDDYLIYFGKKVWRCKKDQVMNYILEMIQNEKYFITKGIRPLNYQGIKIEARVYLQKVAIDEWHVTHTIVKNDDMGYDYYFMGKNNILNEILQELFPNGFQNIIDKIIVDSISTCLYLEKFLPDLASCYLDFLMDEMGNLFLVYFGGWEQQEWLVRLKDPSVWVQYLGNALRYLMYMTECRLREENDDVD